LASTTRIIEEQKIERLITTVQHEPIEEYDLIAVSQAAIDFLEQQTLGEPENRAELASLREPKESKSLLRHISKYFRFLSPDLDWNQSDNEVFNYVM
jgi:hypothetical protein